MVPLAPSIPLLLLLFQFILWPLDSLALQWACTKLQALQWWASGLGGQMRVLGNEGKFWNLTRVLNFFCLVT